MNLKASHRAISAVLLVASFFAVPLSVAAKDKPKDNPQPQALQDLVWPPPPAPAKIKWVGEYRNEFDVGAKKRRSFVDRLSGKGQDVLWLARPLGIAVDDEGIIYVGDFGVGIIAIDPANHRMWKFSAQANVPVGNAVGLAADSKGLYVCDAASNTIAYLDKNGQALLALGANDGVKKPVGIAVDESRDLVVAVNGGNHEILLLNRQLKLRKKIGGRGVKPGQFNFPTYVCMVPGIGFAVSDTANFRIQIFDYDGRFLRSFGKTGDGPGNFSRPKGVAVDPDGQLYVLDSTFANFQVFRTDGQVLTFVGRGGADRGEFQVPTGIAIKKDGTIYVTDEYNRRIQIFQYLGKGGEEKGTSQAKP